MDGKKVFSVIVIGGSVSGLTMAHLLERLGIQYTLLERGSEIAFAGGASIGLQPHALRIMDQLGMYEDILSTTIPMSVAKHRRSDGKAFAVSRFARQIEERHGYPILFFEREELLKILYQHLKDKTKIFCSKKAIDIQSDAQGATVTTADGSIYTSDIVIGADGVNSYTRQAMWKLMAVTEPDLVKTESSTMFSEYACAFGVSIYDSEDPEFVPGHAHITYNEQKSSIVILSTRKKKFWFLILKHDRKYFAPNIPRYSLEDAEAAILENKDWHVTAETKISELWEKRTKFTMVSLEEAMFERWLEDRLVLLGDAVHKVTPNAGHGGNTAIESAVTLANLLNKAKNEMDGYRMTYTGVMSVFEEYQRTRQERVRLACTMSSMATRLQAMDKYLWKLLGLHVIPLFGEELEANSASELILGGQPLDFVHYKGKNGTIPWEGWTTSGDPFVDSHHFFARVMSKGNYLTGILLTSWIAWTCQKSAGWTLGTPESSTLSKNLTSTPHSNITSILALPYQPNMINVNSPYATLTACFSLLPIGVIIAVESLRRGNVKNLPLVPFFTSLSLWYGGLSGLGVLFLIAYAIDLNLSPSRNPHDFVLATARAKSMPIAVGICTLIVFLLPTSALQILWPVSSRLSGELLQLTLHIFPILPFILTEALSKLQPEDGEAQLVQGHPDIGSLKAAYALSMIVSALAHICDIGYGLVSIYGLMSTDNCNWQSLFYRLIGAASLSPESRVDYIIFVSAALLFVYSCSVRALPQRSQSIISKLKLAVGMAVITAIFGPGTTAAFLWVWREDKIRCDKLSPVKIEVIE